jgi:hypothetical protein
MQIRAQFLSFHTYTFLFWVGQVNASVLIQRGAINHANNNAAPFFYFKNSITLMAWARWPRVCRRRQRRPRPSLRTPFLHEKYTKKGLKGDPSKSTRFLLGWVSSQSASGPQNEIHARTTNAAREKPFPSLECKWDWVLLLSPPCLRWIYFRHGISAIFFQKQLLLCKNGISYFAFLFELLICSDTAVII